MENLTNHDEEVGRRLKEIRKVKNITQMQLLATLGSKSLKSEGAQKANYISMLEHGKRKLTEKNIKKIAEKYGIRPGYLRLETDYMTDLDELKASAKGASEMESIRKNYYRMLLAIHNYQVSYKDGECIITDCNNNSVSFERDPLLQILSDFESHFIFHIGRLIDQEAEKKKIRTAYEQLLSFGEGK